MQRVGIGIHARREEMVTSMSNAPALVNWQALRFLHEGNTLGNIEWMILGAAIALGILWVLRRRRRRWF
jgi:LPXTG-motif cell wall-anchored protein